MVYFALIKSKLEYGITLWGNSKKSTLDKLNKIHNRAIRCITGLPFRTALNKLYANAGVLKIKELTTLETAKYMYKLHANMKSGIYSSDDISLVNTVLKYCTRQAEHKSYFVSNALTSICPNCLLVNGTKIWNKLPHTFKSELNFRRFKHLVFDCLLKTYSYHKMIFGLKFVAIMLT